MIETIGKISGYVSIPLLAFLAWIVASIWKRQEGLYKQQLSTLTSQVERERREIDRLKGEVDTPGEIHSQLEIFRSILEERHKDSDIKIAGLESKLDISMEALKQTIDTMDPTFTERQSALLRIYRHETRKQIHDIENSLLTSESILRSSTLSPNDKLAKLEANLNELKLFLQQLDGRLDVEKIISDHSNGADATRDEG